MAARVRYFGPPNLKVKFKSQLKVKRFGPNLSPNCSFPFIHVQAMFIDWEIRHGFLILLHAVICKQHAAGNSPMSMPPNNSPTASIQSLYFSFNSTRSTTNSLPAFVLTNTLYTPAEIFLFISSF